VTGFAFEDCAAAAPAEKEVLVVAVWNASWRLSENASAASLKSAQRSICCNIAGLVATFGSAE
jgi:hypothetical protein